ncbi:MAG: response regulator, partial [Bacteroidota bacterium]
TTHIHCIKVDNSFYPSSSSDQLLILDHTQRSLHLGFSTNSYINSRQNTYWYRLVGLDEEWRKRTDKPEVQYFKLPPGSYRFEVKAQNNDGMEGPVSSLDIRIMPPWWESSQARITGFLMFLALFVGVFRWRTQQIKLQRDKLELKVAARTKALSTANEHLIQQNEEITQQQAQINLISERLHEQDQFQLRFFANISHEFKTPITLILAPIELLLNAGTLAPKTVRPLLLSMRKHATRLHTLINQLLEFRKVHEGTLMLKPQYAPLKDMLKEWVEGYQALAKQKHLTFDVILDIQDISFYFDADVVEKILNNLVSNAFKYTPTGGRVELNATVSATKGVLNILVKDAGVGIPQEKLALIFNRFYRGEAASTRNGSGIGLAYTQELVRLHGGHIDAHSTVGQGSTFTITLPVKHLQIREKTHPLPELEKTDMPLPTPEFSVLLHDTPHKPDTPLLLIVEDNPEIQELLTAVFTRHYQVITAGNGKVGLQKAQTRTPDLIISDLMMPEMDGLEMSRALKSDVSTSHIPIILLTAKNSDLTALNGYEIGISDYLTKPFNPQLLVAKVKSMMEHQILMQKQFTEPGKPSNPSVNLLNDIDQQFINRLIAFIIRHLGNPKLNASDLAREMALSKSQLYRKIKSISGQSTNIFVRNVRL